LRDLKNMPLIDYQFCRHIASDFSMPLSAEALTLETFL
jgi:hypothetical protein